MCQKIDGYYLKLECIKRRWDTAVEKIMVML